MWSAIRKHNFRIPRDIEDCRILDAGEPQLRYFVNVTANEAVLHDQGEGFSDLYQACTHAVELAAELVTQYPRRVKSATSSVPLTVEVVDGKGAILFRSPVG